VKREYCALHAHYVMPCVLCAKLAPASKPRRHKWVYPEIHVYVCKVCGMRKRNEMQDGWWKVIYRSPVTGAESDSRFVPPCVDGPFTPQFLSEYADAIEKDVRKNPAPSTVLPPDWKPPF